MSEASRTPETDEREFLIHSAHCEELPVDNHGLGPAVVPSDFARSLETQRDAALERERGLREALQRAMPALWIMATSGNADAIAIHEKALAALAAKEEK